ncbi:MAG: c-type cytochrome biogenesis protein CcmI [Gammaproteobacteria bacterium]|nr:MAG: c-type cytochrome biogenesis protein CcmI [Gammaproteobacteria bacterium]
MFWLISVTLTLIALATVLLPLLRPARHTVPDEKQLQVTVHRLRIKELEADLANQVISQTDFDQARTELDQQLLEDIPEDKKIKPVTTTGIRSATISLLVAIPALAFGLYLWLGNMEAIDFDQTTVAVRAGGTQYSMNEIIENLEKKLQQSPDSGKGWVLLGKSYVSIKQYDKAVLAFARAHDLLGDDPGLLTTYAEALAMSQQGRLEGMPTELINKTLEIQPNHPKALWLAGHAALQTGKRKLALKHWTRLRKDLKDGTEAAITVDKFIAQVGGTAVSQAQTAPQATSRTQTVGVSLNVSVKLDPSLRNKVSGDETLFIYARAAQGPRMPLAIVRKQAKDLPVTVTLDDNMAMAPNMSLSKFKDIVVGARISKSGNAISQSGDLMGQSNILITGATKTINITIATPVP